MALNGALVQPWNDIIWEENWTSWAPVKSTLLCLRELGLVTRMRVAKYGVRYDLTDKGVEMAVALLSRGELSASLERRGIDIAGGYKRLRKMLNALPKPVTIPHYEKPN